MKSILIATPMHNAECSGLYTKSLLDTVVYLKSKGYDVAYEAVMHDALLTRSRNTLVHLFLKTSFDYLLFIDADMSFSPLDIEKMIDSDVDVVAGAFPKKTIQEEYGLSTNNLKLFKDLVECDYVGTGIILIKKEVFLKLKDSVNHYINVDNNFSWMNPGEIVYSFFDTAIVDNQYLPESYWFCKEWKKTGGKIYVYPDMNIGHVGNFLFFGNFSKSKVYKDIDDST